MSCRTLGRASPPWPWCKGCPQKSHCCRPALLRPFSARLLALTLTFFTSERLRLIYIQLVKNNEDDEDKYEYVDDVKSLMWSSWTWHLCKIIVHSKHVKGLHPVLTSGIGNDYCNGRYDHCENSHFFSWPNSHTLAKIHLIKSRCWTQNKIVTEKAAQRLLINVHHREIVRWSK